eukprot:m.1216526 g.1216526  ORF g.1216526 m.1216526 type:complete len:1148 (+) comp24614_c0_seq3:114-3557(+)
MVRARCFGILCWGVCWCLFCGANCTTSDGQKLYTYNLEVDSVTSAGVYDKTANQMVHTLWSGVEQFAGINHFALDKSNLTTEMIENPELYDIRVVGSGKIQYIWQGVLGNTGPLTGPGVLRCLDPIADITIAGGKLVWCCGYNERQPGCFTFDLDKPQISMPVSLTSFERDFVGATYDNNSGLVYLLNQGGPPTSNNYYHLNETFIVAYNISQRSTADPNLFCMHNFTDPGATTLTCTTDTSQPQPPFHCRTDGCISTSDPPTWLALDFARENKTSPATCNSNTSWYRACHYSTSASGIDVQRRGPTLMVAHAYLDNPEVRFFAKVGGKLLSKMPLPESPGKVVFAPDGDSFWTILLNTRRVVRFATPAAAKLGTDRSGDADYNAPAKELAHVNDLPTVCALAVHPVTGDVWMADRRTQMIHIFPPTGGSAAAPHARFGASLGLSFPYIGAANTTDGNLFQGANMACLAIAFTDDGSEVWISDPGNHRILRVDVQTEAILDTVMFLLRSYTSAVDWKNTSRVFSNFLEFEVDYNVPLTPSSGWKFVRNWGSNLPPEYRGTNDLNHWPFAGFHSVVTVGGHTLAMVSVMPNILVDDSPDGEYVQAVELMENGTLRVIANFSKDSPRLHPDGSLRTSVTVYDKARPGHATLSVVRAPFDAAAVNWTTWTVISNVTVEPPFPERHYGSGEHPLLDVDVPDRAGEKLIMILDGSNNPNYTGFHLAAARWNTTNDANVTRPSKYAWGASPGGVWTTAACNKTAGRQIFEDICVVSPNGDLDRCGGHFPCGANNALTAKGSVIYGFNGEGWKQGQANQWLHFDALSGLFIGQFGTANRVQDPKYDAGGYALPGAAGNSFSGKLITRPDGNVYLYHNDESAHGGVHRWRIQGLDSLQRLTIPLTAGSDSATRSLSPSVLTPVAVPRVCTSGYRLVVGDYNVTVCNNTAWTYREVWWQSQSVLSATGFTQAVCNTNLAPNTHGTVWPPLRAVASSCPVITQGPNGAPAPGALTRHGMHRHYDSVHSLLHMCYLSDCRQARTLPTWALVRGHVGSTGSLLSHVLSRCCCRGPQRFGLLGNRTRGGVRLRRCAALHGRRQQKSADAWTACAVARRHRPDGCQGVADWPIFVHRRGRRGCQGGTHHSQSHRCIRRDEY